MSLADISEQGMATYLRHERGEIKSILHLENGRPCDHKVPPPDEAWLPKSLWKQITGDFGEDRSVLRSVGREIGDWLFDAPAQNWLQATLAGRSSEGPSFGSSFMYRTSLPMFSGRLGAALHASLVTPILLGVCRERLRSSTSPPPRSSVLASTRSGWPCPWR